MANISLKKLNDRSFVNPFLGATVDENPLNNQFKEKIRTHASNLMKIWEKNVGDEIDYTENWNKYSVYTGISGYALLYLELGLCLKNDDYIEKAYFLSEKCTMHVSGSRHTFLTGDGGPLAISAVCSYLTRQYEKQYHFIHRLEKFYKSSQILEISNDFPNELLYGRVGCLFALLFVKRHVSTVDDQLISFIVKAIIDSGRKMASQERQAGHTVPPLMYEWHAKKYLGAAHGMAGIIYLLFQVKEHLDQDTLENFIRPSLDFLLQLRFPGGNFRSSLENDTDRLVQWCHGAPGFVHCFVAAFQVFQDSKYLEAARQAADVIWERGILTKGFSLCHGIAGNGYSFLHLYQVTRDPVFLFRAARFADILVDAAPHEFRTPDHPWSLFEGTAGVIRFLYDLLEPESSRFQW